MEQKQLISKEDVIFNFLQIVRSRKNFRIEKIIIIIATKKRVLVSEHNILCPNKHMSRNHFRKGSERRRKTHFFIFNLLHENLPNLSPFLSCHNLQFMGERQHQLEMYLATNNRNPTKRN